MIVLGWPVAVKVKLPAVPTTKVVVLTPVKAGASFTVRVNDWVALEPTPLVAVKVRLYTPPEPATGVPEIAPVVAFRARGLGRVPAVRL